MFGHLGDESRRIDAIVTSDASPRIGLDALGGSCKVFACIDGLLAAVSVKANLDSRELYESLENLCSIPAKRQDIGGYTSLKMMGYNDWPYKVIFAADGITSDTAANSLDQYYADCSDIPITSRPNLFHVAGKFCMFKYMPNALQPPHKDDPKPGSYLSIADDCDALGVSTVASKIATISN